MTPKQLRYFTTIIRLGGVGKAAAELGVSQAAVSASIAGLRRELGDPLFHASRNGLRATVGGQRLAHRAPELLRLQEETARAVACAREDRRLVRVMTTSLLAEYAAPGLCDAIAAHAPDIDTEFVASSSDDFSEALLSGRAELAIGPRRATMNPRETALEFLSGEVISVCADPTSIDWRTSDWFIGPSAVEPGGVCQFIIGRARVPRTQQRLCSSHSAAVEQARRGRGVALVPGFAAQASLSDGTLRRLDDNRLHAAITWTAFALTERMTTATRDVLELLQSAQVISSLCGGGGVALERARGLAPLR